MGSVSLLPISHAPKSSGGSSSLLPLPHGSGAPASGGVSGHGGSVVGKSLPAVATMQKLIMDLGNTVKDHPGFNERVLKERYHTVINPSVMLSVGKAEMVDEQETWKTDGKWGPHTDAGLAEALKLGVAIEKAHADLGLPGEPFVSEQMKELIPENYTKASGEIADKISSELDALKQDYIRDVGATVSQHTDRKEDFYAKTHKDEVVPQLTLPGGIVVRLSDLENASTLSAVLQKAYPGVAIDVKEKAKELLAQLGHAPVGQGVVL